MKEDYEINVDPDLANKDALTIFINYRVFDYAGRYIGATGIGLTVDAVRHLIALYQERFHRTVYFVDQQGRIVLFADQTGLHPDLRTNPGVGPLVDRILEEKKGSYQFTVAGDNHILNVNYLPELKWYLFVEQNEEVALAKIRHTLYVNLAISMVVTLIAIYLTYLALGRYQSRIEEMASSDELTGLLNRYAYSILQERMLASWRRTPKPISVLLIDIDHFKSVNDRYGHLFGDRILAAVARLLREVSRNSDIAVRWGGEEFLLVLADCGQENALRIAENLRERIARSPLGPPEAMLVTVSVGVAEFDGAQTFDRTIACADEALYAAKKAGRNRICSAETTTT
ncbi:sensor domain-containing diguanylate cyclase [Candidatus Accumulibacter contiguus]|jgi:diguanylate cyclase (GGDEF)-like protein|uniref:sensor domain-containing diguanylate cyclase n=1 Tax=Candidatus Accumulibacter contiguus TaxID=2954381 RepID=UPI002FC2B9DB